MKIKNIILIAITFVAMSTTAQQERNIAFYNVENLFDTINTPDKNDTEYLPTAEIFFRVPLFFSSR